MCELGSLTKSPIPALHSSGCHSRLYELGIQAAYPQFIHAFFHRLIPVFNVLDHILGLTFPAVLFMERLRNRIDEYVVGDVRRKRD
jgi:hypothetical protein